MNEMVRADQQADTDEQIAVAELADELQCHKQSLFKIAKRLQISPVKMRDAERKNQFVSVITRDEAAKIRAEFIFRSRTTSSSENDQQCQVADVGVFYLLQLEPEHDPGRLKVGFTTDLDGRIRKHRCSAPFATCIKAWPCRRNWERTAIDCVTAGLQQLHTEVFRAPSLTEVVSKAEEFFSLMPAIEPPTYEASGSDERCDLGVD